MRNIAVCSKQLFLTLCTLWCLVWGFPVCKWWHCLTKSSLKRYVLKTFREVEPLRSTGTLFQSNGPQRLNGDSAMPFHWYPWEDWEASCRGSEGSAAFISKKHIWEIGWCQTIQCKKILNSILNLSALRQCSSCSDLSLTQQLRNGLPWNFVKTFMVPRGQILITLVVLWFYL